MGYDVASFRTFTGRQGREGGREGRGRGGGDRQTDRQTERARARARESEGERERERERERVSDERGLVSESLSGWGISVTAMRCNSCVV